MNVYKCEEKMTVKNAPVGLFLLESGCIICISQYRLNGSREATILSSGENYCGGDDEEGWSLIIS